MGNSLGGPKSEDISGFSQLCEIVLIVLQDTVCYDRYMSLAHKVIRFIVLISFASYLVTMICMVLFLASTIASKAFGGYPEALSATKNALWVTVGADKVQRQLEDFAKDKIYHYVSKDLVNPVAYIVTTVRSKSLAIRDIQSPLIPKATHTVTASPNGVNLVTVLRF